MLVKKNCKIRKQISDIIVIVIGMTMFMVLSS